MIRRKPLPKRSLKGLEIVPPPPDVSLERVADGCQYEGSGYHRTIPGPTGQPASKPRGTTCPVELQRDPRQALQMLRLAVRAGHCGKFERGFPRRVWSRKGDTIFEARQGSPGSGRYHGYPLDDRQKEEFLRRNAQF